MTLLQTRSKKKVLKRLPAKQYNHVGCNVFVWLLHLKTHTMCKGANKQKNVENATISVYTLYIKEPKSSFFAKEI